MITLVPIKGAPGYRIDMENEKVYSYRNGNLKELATRTKYKCLSITIDGKLVGSTVYRLMYSVQNDISLMDIPEGLCIGKDKDGNIKASLRSELSQRALAARWRQRERFEQVNRNVKLVSEFFNGNSKPLLDLLHKIEKKVKLSYIIEHGLCEERADIISSMAVDSYLDSLQKGNPSVYITGCIYRYARLHNSHIAKPRLRDDGRIIKIERA